MTIPADFIRNLFDYAIRLGRLLNELEYDLTFQGADWDDMYDSVYSYAEKRDELLDVSRGVLFSLEILDLIDEYYSYYDTYNENLRSSEND